MTGIDDAVQNDSLRQRVHQPVVQLVINNLSRLQVGNIILVLNTGQHSRNAQFTKPGSVTEEHTAGRLVGEKLAHLGPFSAQHVCWYCTHCVKVVSWFCSSLCLTKRCQVEHTCATLQQRKPNAGEERGPPRCEHQHKAHA